MKKDLQDEAGFVLLLALLVISVLLGLALHFHEGVRHAVTEAHVTGKTVKAGSIARSGIQIAMAALYEDGRRGAIDTLREQWAFSEGFATYSQLLYEDGTCIVAVRDHCSRINVNSLLDSEGRPDARHRRLLERLLEQRQFGIEPELVSRLLDALTDWLDADDEVTGFGAESSYYMSLSGPYRPRNGRLGSVDELLMVKGFTEELLYGTEARAGIAPFLTVYGDGRLNINTAPSEVLMALSETIDRELAEAMERYRMKEENDLEDPSWYKKVPGMAHITIDMNLIKVSSDYFEINSSGSFGGRMKTLVADLFRPSGKKPILLSIKVLDPGALKKAGE